jgi:uncharacterized delta-60 repeat protein
LIAGRAAAASSGPGEFWLTRLTPDGKLDSTFGTGGIELTDLAGDAGVGHLLPLADGNVLAVGSSDGNLVLARYTASGTLDPTFGSNGLESTGVPANTVTGAILPSGRILVGALKWATRATDGTITSPAQFALVLFSPGGTPDSTYGVGGVVRFGPGPVNASVAYDQILLTPTGGLLAGGIKQETAAGNYEDGAVVVTRFTPDGVLDPSFGTGGTASVSGFTYRQDFQTFGSSLSLTGVGALALGLGGTVEVSADLFFNSGSLIGQESNIDESLFARLTPAGLPDSAFGQGGRTGIGDESVSRIMPLADGRFLWVGSLNSQVEFGGPSPPEVGPMDGRTRTDGSADPLFSPPGGLPTAPTGWTVGAVQSNGRLIAADAIPMPTGATNPTGKELILARYLGDVAPATSTVADPTPNPPGGRARLVGSPLFAAGADAGGGAVTLYNPDGSARFTVSPFGTTFTGGVRTAVADFNGDGVPDLVVGTGPGVPTQVEVLDGKDQHVLFSIAPFEAAFTGGVYVAAGDLSGGGVPDLVVTPDEGGGPRVRVFDGKNNFALLADFFGIADPSFRGGARAAVGDVNGDGAGDLVVAAGFGGGPRVAVFDGTTLASGNPSRLFNDFYAFEQTLRNGVFIAAGDITGSGKADIVAGGGPGGGPRVTLFSAADLISSGGGTLTPLANFFVGDTSSRGGVRVAVKDLDGDSQADLVAGSGSGAGSHVTAYLGKNILPTGTPTATLDFDAFAGFAGGVFVG